MGKMPRWGKRGENGVTILTLGLTRLRQKPTSYGLFIDPFANGRTQFINSESDIGVYRYKAYSIENLQSVAKLKPCT
jgi:hypothetical protein